MRKLKTSKSMLAAFEKLLEQAEEEGKYSVKLVSQHFNSMLDDLLGDDFFGTEGQLDPRGDRRNWE